MNVTISLPDDLCKRARHRAVDEEQSLSAWLASLVARELSSPAQAHPRTWIDAFSSEQPEWFYEKELPLEDRKAGTIRPSVFEQNS